LENSFCWEGDLFLCILPWVLDDVIVEKIDELFWNVVDRWAFLLFKSFFQNFLSKLSFKHVFHNL